MSILDSINAYSNDDEKLNYLSDCIRYYAAEQLLDSEPAASCLQIFASLLTAVGGDNGSIVLQEHWALFHEVCGRTNEAVKHREREIELIEQLFAIGGPVGPVDYGFLIREMRTLAKHYHQLGENDKAEAVLHRIQNLQQ